MKQQLNITRTDLIWAKMYPSNIKNFDRTNKYLCHLLMQVFSEKRLRQHFALDCCVTLEKKRIKRTN